MTTSTGNKRQNTSASLAALRDAVAALGGFALSCFDARHCSRCSRPLTDPASRQLGIGPICNALTTKLAASAKIPANYPLAVITCFRLQEMSSGVPNPELGALIDSVAKAVTVLVMENAAHAADLDGYKDCQDMHAIGSDNRLLIQAVDTILSFQKLEREFKRTLIRLVKELGYVGVAGVMAGHGSTGPSKLTFNAVTGSLSLTGSMNKPGMMAVREACPKAIFSTYPAFLCTVGGHAALKLIDVALEYWPMLQDSDVQGLQSEIRNWQSQNKPVPVPAYAAVVTRPAPTGFAPYVSLRVIDGSNVGVTIQNFDWKGHACPGMVNKIKADINPKNRKYDGLRKEWVIKLPQSEAIATVESFAKQFGLELAIVG